MTKKTIYFLCTANSCRSQMAEGFAKKYLGDTYEVFSAGIDPAGIHPFAIKVMKEKEIDISYQTSDLVSSKLLNAADFVITLCKDSLERCPITLPRASHFHWAFDDPAKVKGTEEEVLESFRCVRDEIEITIQKFIQGDVGTVIDFSKNQHFLFEQRDDFGERIKRIRESKGLTIDEFAIVLEVTGEYLAKTEENMTKPSKFFIHRLAKYCQIEFDDIINNLYYSKSSDMLA